jgi:diguanylate cyclase (GGDEF)-like protein
MSRRDLPLSVIRLDHCGQVVDLMEDGLRLGHAGAVAVQQPFAQALTASHRALWELTLWPSLVAGGSLSEVMVELRGEQGSVISALTYWQHDRSAAGASVVGLLVPGTQRQELSRQLRRSQESLQAMPAAVLQLGCSPTGELQLPYAAGALLELMGVTCTQVVGDPGLFLAALDEASRHRLLARLRQDGPEDAFSEVITPAGRGAARLEISASRPLQRGAWHGVIVDVSDRERLQAELHRLATTDELTRLPNRHALVSGLAAALQSTQRLAVCFMDCDRFKHINDSLGHGAGDDLLRQVAKRLRAQLRSSDQLLSVEPQAGETVAARLGGDEFVIMATGVDSRESAGSLAQRLVDGTSGVYRVGDTEIMLTVSMGVALSDGASTPEQLLRDADTAMYEAKRAGRGRWVMFEHVMHDRVAHALALESELRQALATGAVRAAFQPIVDIRSGKVRGLEALARWRHPVRGDISPAEFIPVAEDSGQISALGHAVLEEACAALAGWRSQGLGLAVRVSVNLSRAQLSEEELPQRIAELLQRFGVPPDAIQLEITESMAMEIHGLAVALERLRAVGVRLSIDDFGTGHSSLAALHGLPVQQVKIDRSFIREIGGSPYHKAVVQAALHVASSLQLDVVAEGVETIEQAEMLGRLGCPSAQGWLYSRAVERVEVIALLQQPSLPAPPALPKHPAPLVA